MRINSPMKTLVTGGTGFIGSHLVDKLLEKGHDILIIDNLSTGKEENINPKAKFYKADIRDNNKIAQIFKNEKPEVVFHFAAQINLRKSLEDPVNDIQINLLGGLNILRNSYEFGIKKFIFASSGGAIYGEANILPTTENYEPAPQSTYGLNKLTFEKYLRFYKLAFDLDFVSLRFANVYGPRQNFENECGVVAIFIDKLLRGEQPVIFGDGNQTRDFLYVDDAVRAAISVMEFSDSRLRNPIFNIGTSQETSINEIFQKISSQINPKIKPIYGPTIKGEVKRIVLAGHKIKSILGFEPKYDLEKGLEKTIKWFKAMSDI